MKTRSKYRAKKTTVNGITFDSRKEADRYIYLMGLQQAGAISCLELQKEFELIPKQRDESGKAVRKCSYFADFTYYDNKTGKVIVEDVKGMKTDVYKIKAKLMLQKYGITIKEV